MKKLVKALAIGVLSLAILSLFSWISIQVSKQDKEFGILTKPIKYLYTFPDLFVESVEEVKTLGLPPTFLKTPEGFVPINELENDLIVLTAYSDTNNSRSVALINLRNDSLLYKWTFGQPILDHERIFHPLLLPKKDLVYSYSGKDLVRVDSMSNVVWKQDGIWPHHSKEVDSNGDIWMSTYPRVYYPTGTYNINGRKVFYKDEFITKVDGETGEILFQKSMTEILRENNLSNYLLKSENPTDPIHTNDVEPALKTTEFYQKDDLFISVKQMSAIFHYRPSTNEILNVIEGPFVGQHDVDFYDDSSLVFFNNNYYTEAKVEKFNIRDSTKITTVGDLYSGIVRYDFTTQSYSFLAETAFREHRIFTKTEGLIDFYEPNTCFVEQQNDGVLWVIKDDKVIYKNVLQSFHQGYHHLPNWTRIIKHPL